MFYLLWVPAFLLFVILLSFNQIYKGWGTASVALVLSMVALGLKNIIDGSWWLCLTHWTYILWITKKIELVLVMTWLIGNYLRLKFVHRNIRRTDISRFFHVWTPTISTVTVNIAIKERLRLYLLSSLQFVYESRPFRGAVHSMTWNTSFVVWVNSVWGRSIIKGVWRRRIDRLFERERDARTSGIMLFFHF